MFDNLILLKNSHPVFCLAEVGSPGIRVNLKVQVKYPESTKLRLLSVAFASWTIDILLTLHVGHFQDFL